MAPCRFHASCGYVVCVFAVGPDIGWCWRTYAVHLAINLRCAIVSYTDDGLSKGESRELIREMTYKDIPMELEQEIGL